MNVAALERYSNAVNDWKFAKDKFGSFRVVFGADSLASVDPSLIWTEGNPGADDQYITNEFLEIDDRHFYVFEKPYTESDGEMILYLTLLLDCECEGEDSDCEVCSGDGVFELQVSTN